MLLSLNIKRRDKKTYLKAVFPGKTLRGFWSYGMLSSTRTRRIDVVTDEGPASFWSSSDDGDRMFHSLTLRSTPQLSSLSLSAKQTPDTLP